jgi:hypothetical protein
MSTEGDIQPPQPFDPHQPVGEGSDIDPTRTETIFSRMPLHVLSKSGKRPQINIERRTPEGRIEEKWKVSYNEEYGPARQLAYDIHTLIIERAIEEAFEEARRTDQPLPRMIPIDHLRDIENKLGLVEGNTNKIKRALFQNAGILITALKKYRGNDGSEYVLEGVFTPYGVFLLGQKMPNGSRADKTYVNLNDAYFEAWSRGATRPLDYNYKAQLPPIPRRFYELVSYSMYGAIKHNHPTARYRYSEFCKGAPQLRYDTFDQVKKQMYKIHKPHIDGQYIMKVKYEETTDEHGAKDWWMVYTPGPRAYAEFAFFISKKFSRSIPRSLESSRPEEAVQSAKRPRQANLKLVPHVDEDLLFELTKRGVSDSGARHLLTTLPADRPILDLLEWIDHEIATRGNIVNPPAFIRSELQKNTAPPANFVSRRKAEEIRLANETKEFERIQQQMGNEARQAAETAELDRQIASMTDADRFTLRHSAEALLAQDKDYYYLKSKQTGRTEMAESIVRARMRKLLKERQAVEPALKNPAIAPETPFSSSETPKDDILPQEPTNVSPEGQILPLMAHPSSGDVELVGLAASDQQPDAPLWSGTNVPNENSVVAIDTPNQAILHAEAVTQTELIKTGESEIQITSVRETTASEPSVSQEQTTSSSAEESAENSDHLL